MSKKISEMELLETITGEEIIPVVINGENRSVKAMSLKGQDGSKGEKGEKGDPGPAGADGKDGVDGYVSKEMYEELVSRIVNLEEKVITVEGNNETDNTAQ